MRKILQFYKRRPWRLRELESGEIFLNQRRIFIMPTRLGLTFCVVLLVLFISAMNYNISLGFALTFFIASCAIVDLGLNFRNLAHLYVSIDQARLYPVFAGEQAYFACHVANRSRYDRYAIELNFEIADRHPKLIDVAAQSSCTVLLPISTVERGWLAAPKVRLRSRFPLGLVRTLSYWRPDARLLVYPCPEKNPPPLPINELHEGKEEGEEASYLRVEEGDFSGIRPYQQGDSIKHLAWRQMAKVPLELGATLLSKHFEEGENGVVYLDFAKLPNEMTCEMKLSRMTSWVIMAEAQGLLYGFSLGNDVLAPAIGLPHKLACLRALALYAN